MTTPNIEELRLLAQTLEFSDAVRCSIQRAADLLQSQAERIKELERESEMRRITLHEAMLEADTLRAQLAAIAAADPVLVVEKEPDYWSVGHFHEGSKPHIKPTKVWCLPIGTQLFTRPMPAQRLTELKLLMLTTAYEQGVGKGIQRRDCNPYAADTDEHAAWKLGYEEGLDKPMPSLDVTELVDALEDALRVLAANGNSFGASAQRKARTALAKYKGTKL